MSKPSLELLQAFSATHRDYAGKIKSGEIRKVDPAVASAWFYGTVVQMVQIRLDGDLVGAVAP